jgi:hypothetical protein
VIRVQNNFGISKWFWRFIPNKDSTNPMRRLCLLIPVAGAVFAAHAFAAEPVPDPVKKPKDAKGQPIVTPKTSADGSKHHLSADPSKPTGTGATKAAEKPMAVKPGDAPKATVEAPGMAVTKPQPGAQPVLSPGTWPKTLEDAKAEAEAKANPAAVPVQWSQAEIELAKGRCAVMLKAIQAVTIPEPPMRQGDCGAPAPVRLVSVGRNPEVVFNPPPVLTCDMVTALHTWMARDLQPLARKHLGAPIIKIESMSDYSCRNAYGRKKSKLSEHGRANALDIRGFVTNEGKPAHVLAGWGDTQRDIKARVLAAKAAEEKAAAIRAAAAKAANEKTVAQSGKAPETTPPEPGTAADLVRSTIVEGTKPGPSNTSLGMAPPDHLGGPKDKAIETGAIKVNAKIKQETKPDVKAAKSAASPHDETAPLVQPPTSMSRFLREAHASACKIFGTTLGPEANNAHRNHFHVDMAPRERSNYCE